MSGKKPKAPPATAQEKALAEIGAKEFNDYAERFVPITQDFISESQATDPKRARAQGIAAADAAQAHAGLDQATVASGLAKGASSGSGKTIMGLGGDNASLGRSSGLAQAQAVQSVDDTALNAKMKIASFGRGLGDDAKVGMMQGLRRANKLAISDAQRRFSDRQSLMTGIGTGIGAYTSFSDLGTKTKSASKDTGIYTIPDADTGDLGW